MYMYTTTRHHNHRRLLIISFLFVSNGTMSTGSIKRVQDLSGYESFVQGRFSIIGVLSD